MDANLNIPEAQGMSKHINESVSNIKVVVDVRRRDIYA